MTLKAYLEPGRKGGKLAKVGKLFPLSAFVLRSPGVDGGRCQTLWRPDTKCLASITPTRNHSVIRLLGKQALSGNALAPGMKILSTTNRSSSPQLHNYSVRSDGTAGLWIREKSQPLHCLKTKAKLALKSTSLCCWLSVPRGESSQRRMAQQRAGPGTSWQKKTFASMERCGRGGEKSVSPLLS